MPAISQWPVVVSLPGETVTPLPYAAGGTRGRREMVERLDIGEAEADQIRNAQRTRARDVAERVAAHVAVVRGVGQFADADAIEHDPDDAVEFWRAFGHEDCLPTGDSNARGG